MTFAEMLTQAQLIQNATMEGENTHERVGNLLVAIVENLTWSGRVPPQNQAAGTWFPSSPTAGQPFNLAFVANTLRATPWVFQAETIFHELAFFVTTAQAADISVGLYADNGNGYPGALITDLSIQNVDASSTGLKTFGLMAPVTIPPGLYWIVSWSDGTPGCGGNSGTSNPVIISKEGPTLTTLAWPSAYADSLTFAALPDPFPSGFPRAFGSALTLFWTAS